MVYVKIEDDGEKTCVKSDCGKTIKFTTKVDVHQGSALSPYFFLL